MGLDLEEKNDAVEDMEEAAPEEEEEEEEEYVVEKIIKHRQTRKGKLEYFVKWEGFTEVDNTWEPVENLNCPEILEKYEAARKKTKDEKKPASAPKKRKTTAGEEASSGKKKLNGFEKGFTAQEIIGATEDKGGVHFLIKWKEAMEDYELLPAATVNVKIPQMVIAFYEARLSWSSAGTEEGPEAEEEGAKNSEEEADAGGLVNGGAKEVAVS